MAANGKTLKIKIKRLRGGVSLPQRMTEGAVGYDVYAAESVQVYNTNAHAEAVSVPLGFALELPKGYHAKLFLRSSIGKRTKIRLANGTGIIDSDYRGEVMLLVENIGRSMVSIREGTRIAQMLIEKNVDVEFVDAGELTDTKRGEGGFGSTGGGGK